MRVEFKFPEILGCAPLHIIVKAINVWFIILQLLPYLHLNRGICHSLRTV